MLKQYLCFLLILVTLLSPVKANIIFAQGALSPLDILILDLQDVKDLIEDGNNKQAIVILKSAEKEVRKVKEFDKETKSITVKRIKKGINLLKKNKNDEAIELIQTGIDKLEEAGFIEPGSID